MKKAKTAQAASRSSGSRGSKAPGKEETFALGQTLLDSGELEAALATWQPLYGLYKTEFDAHCRALAERVLGRLGAGTVNPDGMAREQRLSLYLMARRTHPAHEATASLRSHALGALWTSGTLSDLDLLATLVDSDKALSSSERLSVTGKLRALNANAKSRTASHAATNTAGVAGGAQSAAYILSAAATEFSAQGLNAEAMQDGLFYVLSSLPCADDEATRSFLEREIMAMVDFCEESRRTPMAPGAVLAPVVVLKKACEARLLEDFHKRLAVCSAPTQAHFEPQALVARMLESGLAGHGEWESGLEALCRTDSSVDVSKRLDIALRAPPKFMPKARALLAASEPDALRNPSALMALFEGPAWNVTRRSPLLNDFIALCQRVIPLPEWSVPFRRAMSALSLQRSRTHLTSVAEFTRILEAISVTANLPDLTESVNAYVQRLNSASALLNRLKAAKPTPAEQKILKGKADEKSTRDFVSLLLDAGTLTVGWPEHWKFSRPEDCVTDEYFGAWRTLFECDKLARTFFANSRIKTTLFKCPCSSCLHEVQTFVLPDLRSDLGLSEVVFPSLELPPEFNEESRVQENLANQRDPFSVLGVAFDADKTAILARVFETMRHEPGRMAEIRLAQRELFNPARRAVHTFFRVLMPRVPLENALG